MKYLMIAVLALVLTGCNTISAVNTGIKNTSESAQLDKVCKLAPIVKAGFDLLRVQVTIKESYVTAFNKTYVGLQRICTDRPDDIASALITATRLYGDLLSAQETVATTAADAITSD